MPKLDLLLWGATGFTGRLVADYLAAHAPTSLRWAIGGRSAEKLEAVRAALPVEVETRLADSLDAARMSELAAETRVVCSTVGPYSKYGGPLVAGCVEHGTDYCDLTGETPWIRQMVDAHHAAAQVTGARIVHCCGFDSIPSDLGVHLLYRTLKASELELRAVRFVLHPSPGAVSGGTVASLLGVLEAVSDKAVRRVLADPYALNPEGERQGPDGPDPAKPRFDRDVGRWTGPFLMAAINTRVVRRTNALLGYPYGQHFRYSEVHGTKGRIAAWKLAIGLAALASVGVTRPGRALLRRVAPSPGEGPSKAQRERGWFHAELVATAADGSKWHGHVRGVQDPGYGETAKMLGESALCLACDPLTTGGGVLTPASAMGAPLVDRLRAAGMTFEVVRA